MNRYTYKAKSCCDDNWQYGSLFIEKNWDLTTLKEKEFNYYILPLDADYEDGDIEQYEVDEKTICQCTGLQDKNGKYIFESNIVSGYENVFKAIVEWNTSFCGFYPFCNEETKIFADECKIIGNKFDEVKE